ncbi:MAG: hypothetical protein CMD58_00635 [Gammaproteobacteria bacterium]|nr:hypothetical protein [Gammaproteobacteria bacterium]
MNKIDGRKQRSKKSQKLIVESMIKLIEKGNLYPTAKEVADESGIAIRTVFRQFADLETLTCKADEVIHQRLLSEKKVIKSSSPLANRLIDLIDERIKLYSKYENILLSTMTSIPRNKFLQKKYPEYQKLLKIRTEEMLPEILKLDRYDQELIDATLSFIFWERLKLQGLLNKDIKIALIKQCKKIFDLN